METKIVGRRKVVAEGGVIEKGVLSHRPGELERTDSNPNADPFNCTSNFFSPVAPALKGRSP